MRFRGFLCYITLRLSLMIPKIVVRGQNRTFQLLKAPHRSWCTVKVGCGDKQERSKSTW